MSFLDWSVVVLVVAGAMLAMPWLLKRFSTATPAPTWAQTARHIEAVIQSEVGKAVVAAKAEISTVEHHNTAHIAAARSLAMTVNDDVQRAAGAILSNRQADAATIATLRTENATLAQQVEDLTAALKAEQGARAADVAALKQAAGLT